MLRSRHGIVVCGDYTDRRCRHIAFLMPLGLEALEIPEEGELATIGEVDSNGPILVDEVIQNVVVDVGVISNIGGCLGQRLELAGGHGPPGRIVHGGNVDGIATIHARGLDLYFPEAYIRISGEGNLCGMPIGHPNTSRC